MNQFEPDRRYARRTRRERRRSSSSAEWKKSRRSLWKRRGGLREGVTGSSLNLSSDERNTPARRMLCRRQIRPCIASCLNAVRRKTFRDSQPRGRAPMDHQVRSRCCAAPAGIRRRCRRTSRARSCGLPHCSLPRAESMARKGALEVWLTAGLDDLPMPDDHTLEIPGEHLIGGADEGGAVADATAEQAADPGKL
jgi:hypothetical protein